MTILNSILVYSSILIIASIAGLIADKSGDISFWINGSMIIGSLMYSIMGSVFSGKLELMILSFLIAGLSSGVFSMIHALATIRWKADFILSATALNILSAGLALFVVPIAASKFQGGSTIFLNPFPNKGIGTNGMTHQALYWIIISIIILVLVIIYFVFTKFGLRHKSIGENPYASDAASINVLKYKYISVFISGFLCGIAGSMALTKMNAFIGNVQGLGFIALAIVILGQWRLSIITIGSILFATVWSLIEYNTNISNLIPKELMKSLPFSLSLISLIFLSKFKSSPSSQGYHFVPERGR